MDILILNERDSREKKMTWAKRDIDQSEREGCKSWLKAQHSEN